MCPQFTVLLARTLPEWYGEHSLHRFSVPMLPNTQHLLWGVRKGLREQGFKRGEWMRVNMGVMMHQGKHNLGRLFQE